MKKLIMFMGPPGVGKTDLIKILKIKYPNIIKISKSLIEQQHSNIKNNNEINLLYYNEINNALQHNDVVVVDSHHVIEKERREFVDHVNIKNIDFIGVWVENSWEQVILNNSIKPKENQLDEATLKFLFNHRCSPRKDEPFNDIYYLIINSNLGISRSCPYLTTVQKTINRI